MIGWCKTVLSVVPSRLVEIGGAPRGASPASSLRAACPKLGSISRNDVQLCGVFHGHPKALKPDALSQAT